MQKCFNCFREKKSVLTFNSFIPKIKTFFERIEEYLPFLRSYDFEIRSTNSFPHSSGIASSASGMAALALCLLEMTQASIEDVQTEAFFQKASFLARLGSGSACRSIEGPLVQWGKTPSINNSSNLFGIPYPTDIHPVFENFNLVALIQNVFDILELKASKKGSILRFEEYYQFPIIVNADREKIEQVLINLIENSIKYGRNEGVTNVRIDTQTNGHVTICVSDDGEGINEAHVNRIFERFYRVEKSRSRDQGGSGLGLSIVKHILEAHKQQITVKSEIGKGTTFCFTLDKGI